MALFHRSLLSLSHQCFFTSFRPKACHTARRSPSSSLWSALSRAKARGRSTSVDFRVSVLRRWKCSKIRAASGADMEQEEEADIDLSKLSNREVDALFDEFGEVVRSDDGIRSPTLEADADAESLTFAVSLAEAANQVKAADTKVLHVKPLIYWTSHFVIATAFSRPQIDAIVKRMRDIAEGRFRKTTRGDLKPTSWTLLDFGDVVVHIFLPKERAFYNLEEFYGNAAVIDFASAAIDTLQK